MQDKLLPSILRITSKPAMVGCSLIQLESLICWNTLCTIICICHPSIQWHSLGDLLNPHQVVQVLRYHLQACRGQALGQQTERAPTLLREQTRMHTIVCWPRRGGHACQCTAHRFSSGDPCVPNLLAGACLPSTPLAHPSPACMHTMHVSMAVLWTSICMHVTRCKVLPGEEATCRRFTAKSRISQYWLPVDYKSTEQGLPLQVSIMPSSLLMLGRICPPQSTSNCIRSADTASML